jgi:transcriptional regulator with XRE-family HTH domain
MRLPQGISHLRPELGEILRDHRTYVKGTLGRSVKALAFGVGMTRVALSRIENVRTWSKAQTLDRIIHELDIDWPDVAVRGVGSAPSRQSAVSASNLQDRACGSWLIGGLHMARR